MAAVCSSGSAQALDAFVGSEEWFAAQVWAGRERLAVHHLESRGYEIFYPRYCEYRRWSDRVKRIERALFSGYVFCRIHDDVFGKVLTAPHVIRLVGDGDGPLPIAATEIDAIRRMVDADLRVEPWPFTPVGSRIWIAVGPLAGTEGVVLRTKGCNRLILSVTLLQRSVAVEVDAAWLATTPAGLPGARG